MKYIFLINIYINHLVTLFCVLRNKILNGINFMINIMLVTINVTRKTTHPVIHGNNIGFEAMDKVI